VDKVLLIALLVLLPSVRNSLLFKAVVFYVNYTDAATAIMRALGMIFIAVGLICFPLIKESLDEVCYEERTVTDGN